MYATYGCKGKGVIESGRVEKVQMLICIARLRVQSLGTAFVEVAINFSHAYRKNTTQNVHSLHPRPLVHKLQGQYLRAQLVRAFD